MWYWKEMEKWKYVEAAEEFLRSAFRSIIEGLHEISSLFFPWHSSVLWNQSHSRDVDENLVQVSRIQPRWLRMHPLFYV